MRVRFSSSPFWPSAYEVKMAAKLEFCTGQCCSNDSCSSSTTTSVPCAQFVCGYGTALCTRSAQQEILEPYPARPENHMAQARSSSSHVTRTRHKPDLFYYSSNEARFTYNLPSHILYTRFFSCINASNP